MKNRDKASRRHWAPDEIRHLRRNFGKKHLKELSQEMRRSIRSIAIAAQALGLKKGNNRYGQRASKSQGARVTRTNRKAGRTAVKSEEKLLATVEAMPAARGLCVDNAESSKAHKLATARVECFRSLLDSRPCFGGTYFEQPLLNEAAKRLNRKKKSSAERE